MGDEGRAVHGPDAPRTEGRDHAHVGDSGGSADEIHVAT